MLIAFSAGTILGAALFDLLPEAVELVDAALVFPIVAFGFITFMFLERIIYWYHGHGHEFEEQGKKAPPKEYAYLNVLGDFIHNFIDGMIIAAGFINSFNVGLATTIAVSFHELPQEIGDFGILVYAGMDRRRALLFNFLAALAAVLGGFIGSSFFASVESLGGYMIAFSAGAFIFLSASELIPELHDGESRLRSMIQLVVLVLGMLTIYAMGLVFAE
jgi:zinc and cadmium transporter